MLCDVLVDSSKGARRAMRLLAVVCALLSAAVLSAVFMPVKAEARYLNVKFVIDNIDEHPEVKDRTFSYVCSFYKWNDYKTGGWRINSSKQWVWEELDNSWVAGPNDRDGKYWNYIDAKHGQTVRANAHDGDCYYFYPQIGFTHAKTAAGLSLSRIEWAGNTYQISYNDQGYARYGIIPFNYGGFTGVGDGSVILHMRYDEGIPKAKPIVPELKMSTSKQIDYLGDGVQNPDTPRHFGSNDYRLYLTGNTEDNTTYATYKPKNIILAIDISLSMKYTFDGAVNGGGQRFRSLKTAANTLMEALGGSDPNNRFSVAYFSSYDDYGIYGKGGGSGLPVNKKDINTARAAVNRLDYATAGGTDYYSAFREIDKCCSDTPASMENVVIFLTDGEPSSVPKDVLPRKMGALSQSVVAVPYTQDAAKKLLRNVSQFYSVFIGTNTGSSAVMSMIVQSMNVPEKAAVQASSESEMKALIKKLTDKLKKPEIGVAMEDTLSPYVDLYNRPEYFKVTAKATGSAEAAKVLSAGSDYDLNYDRSSRTIKLKIHQRATKNMTYTLSYDVKANQTAVNKWKSDGYTDTGDPNTDYPVTGNDTSSNKPGFFSSDRAVGQITYNLGSGDQSADYDFPKPVVQVKDTEHSEGKVMGHVTLYNMELTPGQFTFELVDDRDNKPLRPTSNDAKGDFSFDVDKIDSLATPGVYTYKLRQSTPADLDANDVGGDHIKYDTNVVEVKVTVTNAPSGGLEKSIEYKHDSDKKAHFYNSYGIQGTYQ